MHRKTAKPDRPLCLALALAICASAAAQQPHRPADWAVQPLSLDTISVRQLNQLRPDLDAASVKLALVELSEDSRNNAFLPELRHHALRHANITDIFGYALDERPPAPSAHASIIAGLLAGRDPNAHAQAAGHFAYRGAAPAAQLSLYDANWWLYRRVLTAKPLHEDLISISWGADKDDRVTQWWQRGIDALAQRENLLIIAGCGNGHKKSPRICHPAAGHNVLSVGAAPGLGQYPHSLQAVGWPTADLSTPGPTTDGRSKPDVVAPGLVLGPDANDLSAYARTTGPAGFSSFAAPQVAAVAALLIDAARKDNLLPADDPRVTKALLLNGADKLAGWHQGAATPQDDHYKPLDHRQGAGLVNALKSYQQLAAGRLRPQPQNDPNHLPTMGWDLAQLQPPTSSDLQPPASSLQPLFYPVAANPGHYVTATLTWFRQYDQQGLFSPHPHQPLQLELWSLDPNGHPLELLALSASDVDNLCHIWTTAPVARLALVVRTPAPIAAELTFALAYAAGQPNWPGDQLRSDLNADGRVDVNDLLAFTHAWRQYEQFPDRADIDAWRPWLDEDLNNDGRINHLDYQTFSTQWNQSSWWATPKKEPQINAD